MCVPLIEAQVAVSKLLQQCPLNDAIRCLVLEEVNQNVLQTRVLLGCRLLLGEFIQAGILLVEGLRKHWEIISDLIISRFFGMLRVDEVLNRYIYKSEDSLTLFIHKRSVK